jgi:hypothetical protein
MTSITSPLSAILILLCSAPSFATLMTFTDQSAFQTAVANDDTTTIDFESQAHPFDDFTLAYEDEYDTSSGVVTSTYDSTSGSKQLILGVDDEGIDLGFYAGGDFTLSFNQTWQAIGFYLIATDVLSDGNAVLSAGAGSVVNALSPAITLEDGGLAYFFGLIDSDGFTSASLATSEPETFEFGIDDIQLVSAAQASNSVPAPSTLALLAMGVLMSLGFKGKQQSTARTTD